MATQHPDNAMAPYWDKNKSAFISAYQEIEEAVICFQDMDVSEYMWDWEGKHADAAVIDRLFSDHHDYFSKHQLGTDKFLTFRIPNIWQEKGYNLQQAMTAVLSSEDFARDLGFKGRPLFEVILPMTESADQLIKMQELFQKLAKFKSTEFTTENNHNTDYLELIPLVESVESQIAVRDLLSEYVGLHQKHFGEQPEYIRPFFARSDPAIVSGSLATVLANKLAMSRAYEFSAKSDIPVYPISGVGSLPFRGGLKPSTVDEYLKEYPGMRTVSIQSSFRYDHPLAEVKAAIKQIEEKLPKTKPKSIEKSTQKNIEGIIKDSAKLYQATLSEIIVDVQPIFDAVPKRRDRRQHIGLLAYGRSLGEQKMPRAITFTAGFYSLGVPPEFIGIGRSLKALSPTELKVVKDHYVNLKSNLVTAGKFLNRDNLTALSTKNVAWKHIAEDIEAVEKILEIQVGPESPDEIRHQELSTQLLKTTDKDKRTKIITEMAVLRKSLG